MHTQDEDAVMTLDVDSLLKLAGTAVSIAQHGAELVEQVAASVERSKAALAEKDLETLTQMLDQSQKRTAAAHARLDEKLNRIINR
jgi:hypothetical protein